MVIITRELNKLIGHHRAIIKKKAEVLDGQLYYVSAQTIDLLSFQTF